MPANKYASAYLNGHYERMVAAVLEMSPPAFSLSPRAEQFEDAAEHLRAEWISRIDEYLCAVAREASENCREVRIDVRGRETLLSTSIEDSGLPGELNEEAYQLSQSLIAAE